MERYAIAAIARDKRPEDIEGVSKTLRAVILLFLAVIGGAWFLAPDPAGWETSLASLETERGSKRAELSRLKQEASATAGITIPVLSCAEALFAAKALKAEVERVGAEEGRIDVSVRTRASEAEPVSTVMIAEKLRLARHAFGGSCAVRAIWPDIKLQVYVEPTK